MENNKEVELEIKPVCSKCGSSQNYLRISTMQRVCRSCGNIEKVNIKEQQNANL